jgi:hypothetical protein
MPIKLSAYLKRVNRMQRRIAIPSSFPSMRMEHIKFVNVIRYESIMDIDLDRADPQESEWGTRSQGNRRRRRANSLGLHMGFGMLWKILTEA